MKAFWNVWNVHNKVKRILFKLGYIQNVNFFISLLLFEILSNHNYPPPPPPPKKNVSEHCEIIKYAVWEKFGRILKNIPLTFSQKALSELSMIFYC